MAEQGERYRVVSPKGADRTIIGHGKAVDRFVSKLTADGETIVVEDIIGDVLNASENVEYPRGSNEDYRHVTWIEQHPERFELIED